MYTRMRTPFLKKIVSSEHEKAGLKARLGAYRAGQGPASFVSRKKLEPARGVSRVRLGSYYCLLLLLFSCLFLLLINCIFDVKNKELIMLLVVNNKELIAS